MLRVLFVCTANVVRSPAAAALARDDLPGLTVRSAGTHARTGVPISPVMAEVLRDLGVRPPDGGSVPLAPALVESSDLILTMDARQREAVVTDLPRALHRTFTLREFARLAAPLPLPERVAAAARERGRAAARGDDDITDPHGAPAARHRECAALIRRSLRAGLSP